MRGPCNVYTHPWRVRRNLRSLSILTTLEQGLILLDVQIIRAWQVRATRKLEWELSVVQGRKDIGNDGRLVDVHAEDLALLVNTNNAVGHFVLRSDEDILAGYTVHVDARARFEVVQMNEAVLRDEVDDTMFLGDLHGHWEVVGCLSGEEHVDSLLRKHGVGRVVINLDNV